MVILINLSILEKAFSSPQDKEVRTLLNILYNNNIKICLNKNLIDAIEKQISNIDTFRALLTELSDSDRIEKEVSTVNLPLNEQFIEIATKSVSKISFLIPLILADDVTLSARVPNLFIFNNAKKLNRDWIAIELLSGKSCSCNAYFADFKNNSEIQDFFDNIFGLPKFIKEVAIFNKYQECNNYLSKIKSRNISYYTSLEWNQRHVIKEDLQKNLGKKLKLFHTKNGKLIHEQKIIFDNLIITIDNALVNINVQEPTWEINITYDVSKSTTWKEKCAKFTEVN